MSSQRARVGKRFRLGQSVVNTSVDRENWKRISSIMVLFFDVAGVTGRGFLTGERVHGGDGQQRRGTGGKATSPGGTKQLNRVSLFFLTFQQIVCWNISLLNPPHVSPSMLAIRKHATPHPFLPIPLGHPSEISNIPHHEIIYFCMEGKSKPPEI